LRTVALKRRRVTASLAAARTHASTLAPPPPRRPTLHQLQCQLQQQLVVPSTLRYANSAKRIQTRAVVNEDPTARLIKSLTDEVARLKVALAASAATAAVAAALPPAAPDAPALLALPPRYGLCRDISSNIVRLSTRRPCFDVCA
jgi:hypothetical protein